MAFIPKEKLCSTCGESFLATGMGQRRCSACREKSRVVNKTLEGLSRRAFYNHAKKQVQGFLKVSGIRKICSVCGYAKAVDICHIKPVSSFPAGTKIGVINDPKNLILLCKNHHWELDHGLLNLSGDTGSTGTSAHDRGGLEYTQVRDSLPRNQHYLFEITFGC